MYALNHSQYDDHIIPVTIEPCDYEELSWTLGVFQMADMNNDTDTAFTQILQAWGVGFDEDRMSQPENWRGFQMPTDGHLKPVILIVQL